MKKLNTRSLKVVMFLVLLQVLSWPLSVTGWAPGRTTNVIGVVPTVTLDKNINAATVNSSTVFLVDSDQVPVPINPSAAGATITVDHTWDLDYNEFYTVIISTNVEAVDMDKFTANEELHFYTEPSTNSTPHILNTIPQTTDVTWNFNNYISLDYSLTEFAYENPNVAPSPAAPTWAPTNVWVTWDNTQFSVHININDSGNGTGIYAAGQPYSTGTFFSVLVIDVTRDDRGATNFTFPAVTGINSIPATTIEFPKYHRPEFIYYHAVNTTAWTAWTAANQQAFMYWNGSAWLPSAGTPTYLNLQDVGHGLGVLYTADINLLDFPYPGGDPAHRVSMQVLHFRENGSMTAPADDKWLTFDINSDGNANIDGVAVVPTPLIVESTSPVHNEDNVTVNPTISIDFSENVDTATVNSSTVIFYDEKMFEVPAVFTPGPTTVTINPLSQLDPAAKYHVVITPGVSNAAHTKGCVQSSFTFYTLYTGPFYIDGDNGDDNGIGMAADPLRTLSEALIRVQLPDVTDRTVYCTGTFDIVSTLDLGVLNGSAPSPYVFSNWAGNPRPVVDAGNTAINVFEFNGASYVEVHGFEVRNWNAPSQNAAFNLASCDHITIGDAWTHSAGSSPVGLKFNAAQDITIKNSGFFSNWVHVQYTTGASSRIRIENCEFLRGSERPVYVMVACNDLEFVSNRFIYPHTTGIYNQAVVDGYRFIGNYINTTGGHGIWCATAVQNAVFHSNIIIGPTQYALYLNGGASFLADNREIVGNVLIPNGATYAVYYTGNNSQVISFRNNVIDGLYTWAMWVQAFNSATSIRNNIFTRSAAGGNGIAGPAGMTVTYNNMVNITGQRVNAAVEGAGSLTNVSPGFIDTNPANWDTTNFYRLQTMPASAMIDAGDPTDSFGYIEGTAIDIGAFEAPQFTPPTTPLIAETGTATGALITGVHSFTGHATNEGAGFNPVTVYLRVDGGVWTPSGTGPNWTNNYNTVALSDGSRIFEFMASNTGGMTATYTQTNIVDNSVGMVEITNMSDGMFLTGVFTVRGEMADPHSGIEAVVLLVSNQMGVVVARQGAVLGSGSWSAAWDSSILADGTYYAFAACTNGVLQVAQSSASFRFIISSGLPVIRETNTVNLQPVSGNYTFAGYASNVNPSFDPVSNYLTNTGAFLGQGSGVVGWTAMVDTSTLPDGFNSVWFRVDNANGDSSYFSRNITVDNNPPVVTVSTPIISETITGTYAFTGSNVDAVSSISTTTVYFSNSSGVVSTASVVAGDTWSLNYDTTALLDGVNYVWAVSTDAPGFSGTSTMVSFIVDNASSAISETNTPAAGTVYASGVLRLAGNSSYTDPSYPNLSNFIIINSITNLINYGSNWSHDLDTTSYADGPVTINFLALADSGKTAMDTVANVVIDNSPPVITNLVMPATTVYEDAMSVYYRAEDLHSGIDAVVITVSNIENAEYLIITNMIGSLQYTVDASYGLNTAVLFGNGDYEISISARNNAGLVSLVSTGSFTVKDLDFMPMVGPNPFIVKDFTDLDGVIFQGLKRDSLVEIYSLSGDHIISLSDVDEEGQLVWRMHNEARYPVGGGIYICYITESSDKDSEVRTWKVSVVR